METWDAIRARRNVRSFDDQPIAEADLHRILEAGWRSPSASNRQEWHFVVVTDRSRLKELSLLWAYAGHVATSAATVVLVLPEPGNDRDHLLNQYDLGQATMLMMLSAADLGIGSGHASIAEKDECRRLLGIPGSFDPAYFLAFGYPADRPLKPVQHPNRKPFDEVVHFGHW